MDATRIESVIPTLSLLQSARQVTIVGHRGRPQGKIVEELRLGPIARVLSQYCGSDVHYIQSGEDITIKQELRRGKKWNLLENLRFQPGEEANDPIFAAQLAHYGEVFIFDAFGVAHRASASTVGVTGYLPSYAGLRVTEEVNVLTKVIQNPEHPFLLIIGGAKIETKLPALQHLLPLADRVFVGGKLIKEIRTQQLTFPDTVIIGKETESGFDISEDSQRQVVELISQAKLIVWNGPPGRFEEPDSEAGTRAIAEAMAQTSARTVIGGGETMQAVHRFNVADKMDFISVGGGAMLDFLSGTPLPALQTFMTTKE